MEDLLQRLFLNSTKFCCILYVFQRVPEVSLLPLQIRSGVDTELFNSRKKDVLGRLCRGSSDDLGAGGETTVPWWHSPFRALSSTCHICFPARANCLPLSTTLIPKGYWTSHLASPVPSLLPLDKYEQRKKSTRKRRRMKKGKKRKAKREK